MQSPVYQFEEVGQDLPRPPLAALRALGTAGLLVSTKGWAALDLAQRRAFVDAGVAPRVDVEAVRAASRAVPLTEIRLAPPLPDADPARVPEALAAAMRPHAGLADASWASLRPLDRYVLWKLSSNGRLLHRALREILPASPDVGRPGNATIAHATVRMRPDQLAKLRSPTFLDGRAFVLARVAGVRAARRSQETFDVRADRATGTIELDWTATPRPGVVLWQAHVSAWDGSFSVAASLAAAATAAIALADMVAEEGGEVSVDDCRLTDEPWQCGADAEGQDMPTAVLMSKKEMAALIAARSAPAPSHPASAASSPGPIHAAPAPAPPAAPVVTPPSPAPAQAFAPPSERRPSAAAPAVRVSPVLVALTAILALILVALVAIVALLFRRA
jgi:molybdenum cofactor biosynthesis enzyme